MKRLLGLLSLSIAALQSHAQFSIRVNPSNPSAVDILYTAPPVGQGVHPVQFFEFALQIPDPQGSTLTASFAPGAPLAALASFTQYQGTDYGNHTWAWASAGVPNYSNTYNFPAGEVVLGTVTFSGASTGAIVSAIDYQNQAVYGGNSGTAVWTMQVDPGGNDVTNYSSLFYQSSTSGGVSGSDPASTTSDGSASNQKLSLSSTPLPVSLSSFSASASGCAADIEWVSEQEMNLKHYELYRSSDARNWTLAATIAGKGIPSGYSYHDEITSLSYYRLKMVDLDGHSEYSNIVSVQADCDHREIRVFPNPAETSVTVSGLLGGERIELLDCTGRTVYTTVAKTNEAMISLEGIASGSYLISVTGQDDKKSAFKMIKK